MYAITSCNAPEAVGPYSQGTSAARFAFVSGQLPVDPATEQVVPGGIGQQTAQCIRNIEAVLAELDLTLAEVAKTTVYLTDLDNFDAMNEVYAERFLRPGPARSCIEVRRLPRDVNVMIDAIACR